MRLGEIGRDWVRLGEILIKRLGEISWIVSGLVENDWVRLGEIG